MSTGTGRHRAEVKPRYGRIATLGSSVAVVLIAVLGGTGALPSSAGDEPATPAPRTALLPAGTSVGRRRHHRRHRRRHHSAQLDAVRGSRPVERAEPQPPSPPQESDGDGLVLVDPTDASPIDTALPGDSGTGRRVVFSESRQRVWLVNDAGKVRRTYLVSGSIYDNLDPGTFEVFSRDKHAVGVDDSGTMKFFVRFTRGTEGAAIGFHDIPVDNGEYVQTFRQLGTPLSHGCIRQKREDAVALWKFAPVGTTVVVTA